MIKRLAEAGKILGIELIDHIIVAKKSFLVLKRENCYDIGCHLTTIFILLK